MEWQLRKFVIEPMRSLAEMRQKLVDQGSITNFLSGNGIATIGSMTTQSRF